MNLEIVQTGEIDGMKIYKNNSKGIKLYYRLCNYYGYKVSKREKYESVLETASTEEYVKHPSGCVENLKEYNYRMRTRNEFSVKFNYDTDLQSAVLFYFDEIYNEKRDTKNTETQILIEYFDAIKSWKYAKTIEYTKNYGYIYLDVLHKDYNKKIRDISLPKRSKTYPERQIRNKDYACFDVKGDGRCSYHAFDAACNPKPFNKSCNNETNIEGFINHLSEYIISIPEETAKENAINLIQQGGYRGVGEEYANPLFFLENSFFAQEVLKKRFTHVVLLPSASCEDALRNLNDGLIRWPSEYTHSIGVYNLRKLHPSTKGYPYLRLKQTFEEAEEEITASKSTASKSTSRPGIVGTKYGTRLHRVEPNTNYVIFISGGFHYNVIMRKEMTNLNPF